VRYVDWDGNELALEEWGARHQDFAGRKLGSAVVDGCQVITLWHGFGPDFVPGQSAQVFGTAYSGPSGQMRQIRTIDAALHYAGDLLYSDYASDGSDMIGLRRMREAARRHGIPL
jgi:hypothetical protein